MSQRLEEMEGARRDLVSRLAPILGCHTVLLRQEGTLPSLDLARVSWTQLVSVRAEGVHVSQEARVAALEARVAILEEAHRQHEQEQHHHQQKQQQKSRLSVHQPIRLGRKKNEEAAMPLPDEVKEEAPVKLGSDSRSRVLSELINTEAAFLLRLRVITHVFSKQLSSVLSPEQLEQSLLLSHVETIHSIHENWYRGLREVTKEWDPESTCVGSRLSTLFSELPEAYSYYVANFAASNETLVGFGDSANHLLISLRDHPQVGSNDLVSHMIAPVQRAPRLPLLLRELFEVTPDSHPDQKGIKAALESAVAATTKLNSLADDIAAHRQVTEICNRLCGDRGAYLCQILSDSSQISSNRHFRVDIKVRAVAHPSVDRLHLLLFDDLAIFCVKRKGGKLEAMEHLWLREADPISVIQHGGSSCLLMEGTSVAIPPKPTIEIKNMGAGAVSGFPGVKMRRASYKKSPVRQMRSDFSLLFRVEGGEDVMEELRANINSAVAAAIHRPIPGGDAPEPEFSPWGVIKRSTSSNSLEPPLPAKSSSLEEPSPRSRRGRLSNSRISISGVTKGKAPQVFGLGLDEQANVPRVVLECLHELLVRGPEEQGVFRVPGGLDSINKLRAAYEDGKGSVAGQDIANIASLLLSYLRDLPVEALSPSVCAAIQAGECSTREALKPLSRNALLTVCGICYIMKALADAEEETKMNARNLSTCITPDLVYAPVSRENPMEALAGAARHGHAVQQLISEYPDCFPADAVLEITSLIAKAGPRESPSTATSSSSSSSNTPRFSKLGTLFSRRG